ncbi:unnamed protein product [Moneuplotes crassus]|uniref:Uncharacterized protein n=1 Tax=Euplotes crassus TaxID=5936 RepID=A0AAD1XJF5_EUPCR|nr:unnamed protein product [Moneuplotes crassus]
MLEDYLLNNKIIRSYSKLFNEKDLNRVLRCTLILGIQTLKQEVPNYTSLTPQEIEGLIIDSIREDYSAHANFESRIRKVEVIDNDPSPEDTLARKEESPGAAHTKKILKTTKEVASHSRIPKIRQRTKIEQVEKKSPQKSKSQSQKRITFEEPSAIGPQTEGRRGARISAYSRDFPIRNLDRPAGIPSVRNRFDQDWMRLHNTSRPSSVPTRINRFSSKAPTNWNLDNSTFEKDRPRIKRSGSRKSTKSNTAANYPDWWGDGSAYNSKSSASSRSRSRNKYKENDIDDFDRKVTYQAKKKPILKQTQSHTTRNNYIAAHSIQNHYQDPISPEPEDQYDETEEVEEFEDTYEEEPPRRRAQHIQKKRSDKPQVGETIKKGTIYSKLNKESESIGRDEEPTNCRRTKGGYFLSFSPTGNKKKKTHKENVNTANYQYEDTRAKKKSYVRRCENFEKPQPKPRKGKTLKELHKNDRQRAIHNRETFKNTREINNPANKEKDMKKTIPKKFQNVESVIKKRIQIDKEIYSKKKMDNQNPKKEPEVYAPREKGERKRRHKRKVTESASKSRSKSRSDSQNRAENFESRTNHYQSYQNDSQEGENPSQYQDGSSQYQDGSSHHPYYNQRHTSERNQKQVVTEGSSYPSVTQAAAPQEIYDRGQNYQNPSSYRAHEEVKHEQQYQEYSYRPSSISQNPDRENNVVEITEGFLNSPMMTQFSEHSDMQRRPNPYSRDQEESKRHDDSRKQEDSRRHEHQDYSGVKDSASYGQYTQSRSNDSMHIHHQCYDNPYTYNQQSNNKNQTSGVGSNSNPNQSRYHEDQVLFKSNGFDGNATSSGKVDESAMLQSPVINQKNREENSDSKLTGTANFEKPKDYDVKYSDFRHTDAREGSFPRPPYDQNSAEREQSHYNPFTQNQDYVNKGPVYNSGYGPFDYQKEHQMSSHNPGSYKYLPAWEGADPKLNSQHMSMNTGYNQGPPKFLEPQEESKYQSAVSSYYEEEEEESDYTEGEESESEYDSEFSKTDDYRSNSSADKYRGPHSQYQPGQYPPRDSGAYPQDYRSSEGGNFYQGSYQNSNMYNSIPNSSEMNPQYMSSIGSEAQGIPPQFQGNPERGHPGQHRRY